MSDTLDTRGYRKELDVDPTRDDRIVNYPSWKGTQISSCTNTYVTAVHLFETLKPVLTICQALTSTTD